MFPNSFFFVKSSLFFVVWETKTSSLTFLIDLLVDSVAPVKLVHEHHRWAVRETESDPSPGPLEAGGAAAACVCVCVRVLQETTGLPSCLGARGGSCSVQCHIFQWRLGSVSCRSGRFEGKYCGVEPLEHLAPLRVADLAGKRPISTSSLDSEQLYERL